MFDEEMRAEEDSTENSEIVGSKVKLRRCLTTRLGQLILVMLP